MTTPTEEEAKEETAIDLKDYEENKETGKTTLRIPVPNKESVIEILGLAGKLLDIEK